MKLQSEKREVTGKKVKGYRAEGKIPASVYGPVRESTSITVDAKTFRKTFEDVGYNKFIDLEIEGESKPSKVLVKEVQIDPLKDQIISVSFYQVDEDRKITVDVPLILVNEAPAIKQNLGFLVQSMDTVSLICLPKDVPDELIVDISTLDATGDSILLSSLALPDGVEFDSSEDPQNAIVYIAARQKEEEVEETAAEGEEGEEGAEDAQEGENNEDQGGE